MDPLGVPQLLMIAIAGAGVGALSGALGLGGGFLIFPLLTVGFGLPSDIAIGCAACQALGPATTAMLVRKVTWQDFDMPLVMLGGLGVGVWGGTLTLHHLVSSFAEKKNWWPDVVTTGLYSFLLASVGIFTLYEVRRASLFRPISTGWLAHVKIFPQFNSLSCNTTGSLPLLCWFGLVVGFQAGLLGNSGGLLIMPGLIYLFGFPTQRAVAYSLGVVWLVSLKGTAFHAWYGHVDLRIVAALLLGGTIGAQLGSESSRRLKASQVRTIFGWLTVTTSAVLAVKLLVLWANRLFYFVD